MRSKAALMTAVLAVSLLPACSHREASTNPYGSAFFKDQLKRQDALRAAEIEALAPEGAMNVTSHEEMGDYYFSRGELMQAYLQYSRALRFDPQKAALRYKMGRLFLRRGLPEEAKKEFLEVLRHGEEPAVLVGLGQACLMLGEFPEAEEALRRALHQGDAWEARNLLGVVYNRTGRFDGAMEEFEKGILLRPDSSTLYNNLGITFLLLEDYKAAANAFIRAVELGGVEKRTYNNLGLALAKLGRYEEALESFKRGGGAEAAYNNLGYLYSLEGNTEKAVEAYRKAMELSPSFYDRAYNNMQTIKNRGSE